MEQSAADIRRLEYLIWDPPLRALTVFALPIILGSIFQQVYNIADSVILGRFVGQNALAAVGASASLTNVFICIAVGAGSGASVLVSRRLGERDYEGMKRAVWTSLSFFLVLSIALGAAGLFLGGPIMRVLHTPEDVIDLSVLYLQVYFAGFPFLFLYNVLSSMYNAIGKSRIPLYFLIFSSCLNVAMDLFMVIRLHMGVFGAALATLIAQGISAALSFFVFRRLMRTFPGNGALFSLADLKHLLAYAIPSIIQQSTVSIGMMLVQSVVNSFGSEALAGFSATARVENLVSVIFVSIGNAVSPFTAQNLGPCLCRHDPLFPRDRRPLSRAGRHARGLLGRRAVHALDRHVLLLSRRQDGNGRRAQGRRKNADLHARKPLQPDPARRGRHDPRPALWHRLCLVCRAGGLDHQHPHLPCGTPEVGEKRLDMKRGRTGTGPASSSISYFSRFGLTKFVRNFANPGYAFSSRSMAFPASSCLS